MRICTLKPAILLGVSAFALSGCMGGGGAELPPAAFVSTGQTQAEDYVIGPLDTLTIFVWRNPELGAEEVQVRPDGRITTPLIEDMVAAGKTPAMLADDISVMLGQYITDPRVSVIVNEFSGTYAQRVRVIGATEQPASIPYRANMTLLDAMIEVGGLSEFAAGNRARLVRYDRESGQQREYALRIGSLLRRGDTSANVELRPGDVIIIPESMF
ncbi:XrtA/PEP-CTERM system exopolysaccharide export protein [Parasphingopyxis marina]|uniref:Polysaccharide biosynthesis/export family protein n=1 Tax=Parasphingopyxis marina TaxID=2761622 RepID=A0A842HV87_9SPHN|nr:XrtA/PEP-CTERM system exopolysaccharide export protein [Parasphingopyxis marina]MBC2777928.1 polysaccharide biosynthesis/export family protein [Parasphingopyxis marina]